MISQNLYAIDTTPTAARRRGFTIVELLVVIVVIAILAAIVIIAYNGVQQRAHASADSSTLSQTAQQLGLYQLDNGGYPADSPTFFTLMHADSSGNSSGINYQYSVNNTANPQTYCVTATSGNVSYYIDTSSHTSPTAGGCPGQGQGGIAAVTNLSTNPSFESDTAGVSGYYSSPISRDSSMAVSGTYSVVTTTNSVTYRQGIIAVGANPALPNTQYTCSMSLSGTPGYTVSFSGRPATSGGGYISENAGAVNVPLSSSWQRATITFTTPANAGMFYVQTPLTSPASGVTIRADALICVQGASVPNYADGNSANWIWNGTVNDSSSTGPAL